jgi:alpha-tubulin suppressor-like RCC1 family protein
MTQNFNFALVSGAAILLAACGGNNTQTAAPANPVRNPQYVTTTVLDTTRIAGGSGHALGLTSDGNTVYAWGYNGAGQLGNGLTTHSNTPVVVPGLSGIQAVRSGGYHSLALTNASNGAVYAWGDNTFGQLGNSSLGTGLTKRPTLVAAVVGGLSQVRVIGAGQTHRRAHQHQNRGRRLES